MCPQDYRPGYFAEADAWIQAVANSSADGMLVVDSDGRVRFVNPAAERLLHRRAGELITQVFGLPVILGEVAEISLLQADGNVITAEMRTVPIEWAGEPAQMIVLRDLTEQRRSQEALRDAEGFSRAILNSLTHHIAVIDAFGTILLTNDAWLQFAIENGDPELLTTGVGANYFDVCVTSTGSNAEEASDVLLGMQRVLSGELPFFELEYPCNSPNEERWFQLRVVPLQGKRRGLVISHTNITEQRRNAWAAAEAEVLREQLRSRERELRAVGTISDSSQERSLTRVPRAESSLRIDCPEQFQDCVSRYGDLLDAAVDARGFAFTPDIEMPARVLANRLGQLHVAARDIVELHLAALRSRSAGAASSRQQAYLEEGRVLSLQLMGYLLTYYRDGVAG